MSMSRFCSFLCVHASIITLHSSRLQPCCVHLVNTGAAMNEPELPQDVQQAAVVTTEVTVRPTPNVEDLMAQSDVASTASLDLDEESAARLSRTYGRGLQAASTAGDVAFVEAANAGTKVNSGQSVEFKGYRWLIKDSGGGRVGPGPNVFDGSPRFVWVDAQGLHLNVRPRTAGSCDNWASSEVWLDRALGYGTYLFSTVGPTEHLDPMVVWGMFLWDDSGNAANGYREIDFEYAR